MNQISKLAKFHQVMYPGGAAVLLSQLINEEVTEEDILRLCSEGWLVGFASCNAEILKLTPASPPECEEHEVRSEVFGRCMKLESEEESLGLCQGIMIPAPFAQLDNFDIASVIGDKDGGLYALRSIDEGPDFGKLISPLSGVGIHTISIYTDGVYALAKQANNDANVPEKPKRIRRFSLTSSAAFSLYDLPPGDDFFNRFFLTGIAQQNQIQAQSSSSYALAVAALVEIATGKSSKKHNQASLIGEILNKYDVRGLSKSNLEKIFSTSKRQLEEALAEKG